MQVIFDSLASIDLRTFYPNNKTHGNGKASACSPFTRDLNNDMRCMNIIKTITRTMDGVLKSFNVPPIKTPRKRRVQYDISIPGCIPVDIIYEAEFNIEEHCCKHKMTVFIHGETSDYTDLIHYIIENTGDMRQKIIDLKGSTTIHNVRLIKSLAIDIGTLYQLLNVRDPNDLYMSAIRVAQRIIKKHVALLHDNVVYDSLKQCILFDPNTIITDPVMAAMMSCPHHASLFTVQNEVNKFYDLVHTYAQKLIV